MEAPDSRSASAAWRGVRSVGHHDCTVTAIFFPLRGSVELFEDRASPAAPARVKEAAVLYDRVIIESGLYDMALVRDGTGGGSARWKPAGEITEDDLARARLPAPIGEPMSLGFGVQSAKGVEAEEMHTFVQGSIGTHYLAHFQDVLEDLEALSADWVEVAEIGGAENPLPFEDPTRHELGFRIFREKSDKDLLPETETFERDWIIKSFYRDAAVASRLDATFNVTPLFEPLVRSRSDVGQPSGENALRILVPSLAEAPWEAIAEFREHPANAEARGRLREFEERAREHGTTEDRLLSVAQEVSKAQAAAIKEYAPNLPGELGKEALKTMVSLTPGIGPILEKAASVADELRQRREHERSWLTALMRLESSAGA
jgi:hypothetical protein